MDSDRTRLRETSAPPASDEASDEAPHDDSDAPHEHHVHARLEVPILGLVAGCSMSLIAGAPYAFGAYSDDLKDALQLTQTGMANLGIAFDFGLYAMQPVTGTLFDTFGTPITAAVATLAIFLGNGAIALATGEVESGKQPPPAAVVAACFFISGAASSFINAAALGTNTKRTPLVHRARVISAHSTCFGFSSLVVVASYGGLSGGGEHMSSFFCVWAFIGLVVIGGGGLVLSSHAGGAPKVAAGNAMVEDFHAELALEDALIDVVEQVGMTHSDSVHALEDFLVQPLDASASGEGPRAEIPHVLLAEEVAGAQTSNDLIALVHDADAAPAASDMAPEPVALAVHHEWESLRNLVSIVARPSFWMLVLALFCAFGCGLFVINNVSSIVVSAGGAASQSTACTALFPVGNALGRFSFGVFSNSLPGVRRGHWLCVALSLFLVAYVTITLSYPDAELSLNAGPRDNEDSDPNLLVVYVAVFLVSLAYGTTWVTAQSILAEMYPIENFGTMFGIIALMAGIAGFAFNEWGALLYVRASPHGEEDCVGRDCFHSAFVSCTVAAGVGLTAAVAFLPHTRDARMLAEEDTRHQQTMDIADKLVSPSARAAILRAETSSVPSLALVVVPGPAVSSAEGGTVPRSVSLVNLRHAHAEAHPFQITKKTQRTNSAGDTHNL